MNDVEIRVNGNEISFTTPCGEFYLRHLIEQDMALVEKYMCKAEAIELFKLKCALELITRDIQIWFDKWKSTDFKKDGE